MIQVYDGAIKYKTGVRTTATKTLVSVYGCAITSVPCWIPHSLDLLLVYRNSWAVIKQSAYLWMLRIKKKICGRIYSDGQNLDLLLKEPHVWGEGK